MRGGCGQEDTARVPQPVCAGRAHSPASHSPHSPCLSLPVCPSGPVYLSHNACLPPPLTPSVCPSPSVILHLSVRLTPSSICPSSVYSSPSLCPSDPVVDQSVCLQLPFQPQAWGSRQAPWTLPSCAGQEMGKDWTAWWSLRGLTEPRGPSRRVGVRSFSFQPPSIPSSTHPLP